MIRQDDVGRKIYRGQEISDDWYITGDHWQRVFETHKLNRLTNEVDWIRSFTPNVNHTRKEKDMQQKANTANEDQDTQNILK